MVKFEGAANVEQAMEFAKECEERINNVNHPDTPGLFSNEMVLEFEKVFYPYYLLGKKRYIGNKYEPGNFTKGKLDYKGVEVTRRDNCLLLNRCMKKFIDELIANCNINAAVDVVKDTVQKLYNNDVSIENLIISKKLSKMDYANPQAHVEVAKRLQKKNPLHAPQLGDRCEYIICHTGHTKNYDKARHVSEVREAGNPIDYEYYLEKQIKIPMLRLLEPVLGSSKSKEIFLRKNYHIKKRKAKFIVKNSVADMFRKR